MFQMPVTFIHIVYTRAHHWILLEPVESSLRYRCLHLHALSHLPVFDMSKVFHLHDLIIVIILSEEYRL